MCKKFLILVCVAVAGWVSAEQRWNNRVWTIDHGLLDNRIVGVQQSSDGFLWVATVRGIMRFDGVEFKALPISTEFASAGRIHSFLIDSLDRFWITQRNGEIFCLDCGSVVLKIPAPGKGSNPGIPTIIEEQAGGMLLCFQNGDFVRVYDGKVEPVAEENLARGPKRSVVKDGSGQIYYSQGGQGIGVMKDGHLSFRKALRVDLLGGARSGGVWVCSGNELWKFKDSGALERISELPSSMDVERVPLSVVHEDRQGGLWFVSKARGLFYFDGHVFRKVPCSATDITSLDEDRDGNIWIGSTDGLYQFIPSVVKFLRGSFGESFKNALSIAQDTNGLLWVVWSEGKVSRSLNRDLWGSPDVRYWSFQDAKTVPQTQCVVADPAGGVWFGTDTSGLYCWEDGRVIAKFGTENGLSGDTVNALHITRDGTLWIGSQEGEPPKFFLQSLRNGTLQSYPLPSGTRAVIAFASDVEGNCWFATYDGRLFCANKDGGMDEKTALLYPARYSILALCITGDKSLWIGFAGHGLGRLKSGRFTRYRTEQGLHDNYISRILSDQSDRLWLAGNRGIVRVSPEDFDEVDAGRSSRIQSVVYGKQQGLSSSKATEYFWPGAIRDHAGRLLFGMKGGVAMIRPEEAWERQGSPPVVIEKMSVDGRTIAEYGVDAAFPGPDGSKPMELRGQGNQRLRILPGARHIQLGFTAVGFKIPESTVFKCRLQGFERDWNDVGTQRTVSYYGITHGTYQFQVIARNSDGVWNQTGASLAFTLEQYWWEAAWFRVGGFLVAVGGLMCGLLFFARRRQKLQIERLELLRATDKERSRIAADLHDNMGSGLTEIGMTGDLLLRATIPAELSKQYVGEIVSKTRELTEALDEIVWAANPKHDTLASLVSYFVYYIQHVMEKTSIHLKLIIAENLPDVVIHAGARHHLFLAFREVVTNVVKHAAATEVSLTVAVENGLLRIAIQDNGRGIGPRSEQSQGDGLSNMRSRLEQAGGSCLIVSEPGKGTLVQFELQLTRMILMPVKKEAGLKSERSFLT